MAGDEQLSRLEEKYDGYTVNDRDGDKIGKVDELFVDDTDREEYIGVKMGLFGLAGTTLIPMEIARVDERDRVIEVAESKERVKDAPTYSNDNEVNDEFEDRIRDYFGLASQQSSGDRGSYGVMSNGGSHREGATRSGNDREGDEDRGEDREGREGREGPSMERGEREGYGGDREERRDDREEGRIERAEPRGEESRGGESRGGESRDMEPRDSERGDTEPRSDREGEGAVAGRSDEGRGWDEEEETSGRMRVRRRTRREESSSFEQEEEEEHFSR